MSKSDQAKYLGGILTKKDDARIAIQARINATNPAIRSLDVFWKQTKCWLKWKVLIFNAVCISESVYGLEVIISTHATLHKLDTVQMKGLRKRMQIPPTLIDRTQTGQSVLDKFKEEHGVII